MINPQHEVVIEYCVPWDYLDEAVRAAAEIASGWAPILTSIELRTGSKGVFRIQVDGETVFDKASAGHKPTPEEAAKAVQQRLGDRLQWRKPAHHW